MCRTHNYLLYSIFYSSCCLIKEIAALAKLTFLEILCWNDQWWNAQASSPSWFYTSTNECVLDLSKSSTPPTATRHGGNNHCRMMHNCVRISASGRISGWWLLLCCSVKYRRQRGKSSERDIIMKIKLIILQTFNSTCSRPYCLLHANTLLCTPSDKQ